MKPDEWLTPKQVAALYHVHVSTVRNWVQRGELPAMRLASRRYLIKRADAAALLSPVEPGELVPVRHQR